MDIKQICWTENEEEEEEEDWIRLAQGTDTWRDALNKVMHFLMP
jgi:hypothetical protein